MGFVRDLELMLFKIFGPNRHLKQPNTITRLKNGRIREVELVLVNGTVGRPPMSERETERERGDK